MISLVHRIGDKLSGFYSWAQFLFGEYPTVARLWTPIIVVSIVVASLATYFSNAITRGDVGNSLLIGVITLFTISLTVAIMGIRLASSRYSHRVDASVLNRQAIAIHFSPHLLAMLIGILTLSIGESPAIAFFFFIFFSTVAILSIFPFLQWLLRSLTPGQVLVNSLTEIDSEFLDKVEGAIREEQDHLYRRSGRGIPDIFRNVSYLHIAENDPVDAFLDIIRSRIQNDDTRTAKKLLHQYVDHVEPLIAGRYREFLTSHSDPQLVCWYLYSPLEQIFRVAIKEENRVITMEIITLLCDSVESWKEKRTRGIPEVYIRMFGDLTTDYLPECDRSQSRSLASNYSRIASVIASDIDSPTTDIEGAMRSTFVNYSLEFALRAIDRDDYRSARVINHGLRSIVEADLRIPSSNPERTLLALGLIGESFAAEGAKSKHIVEIANEVSVMNEAEWAITTLVTFKDKLEEYNNRYAYQDEYVEMVVGEINRINEALKEHDRSIATEVNHDQDQVMEVIRGSRLIRRPFTAQELLCELDNEMSEDQVVEICDSLVEIGAMVQTGNEEYNKAYDTF